MTYSLLKTSILILLSFIPSFVGQDQFSKTPIIENCQWENIQLYGKVQIVETFPDIKVQIVDHFPDLRVKYVEHFPDECGEWQIVENFPDFKVQIVESFPDIKIKLVDHFPGTD
jgi:hypothetical protein